VQDQLPARGRRAHLDLELEPVDEPPVALAVVELHAAPRRLRAVHGGVGVLQRLARGVPRGGGVHAHAGGHDDGAAAHRHRLRHGVHDPLGEGERRADVDVVEHDGELVPADARHHVGGAHERDEAPGDGAQEVVAGGVPVAVVHGLERVEVEHEQPADAAWCPTAHERAGQEGVEGGPVRHACEGVVGGEVLEIDHQPLDLGPQRPFGVEAGARRLEPDQHQRHDGDLRRGHEVDGRPSVARALGGDGPRVQHQHPAEHEGATTGVQGDGPRCGELVGARVQRERAERAVGDQPRGHPVITVFEGPLDRCGAVGDVGSELEDEPGHEQDLDPGHPRGGPCEPQAQRREQQQHERVGERGELGEAMYAGRVEHRLEQQRPCHDAEPDARRHAVEEQPRVARPPSAQHGEQERGPAQVRDEVQRVHDRRVRQGLVGQDRVQVPAC